MPSVIRFFSCLSLSLWTEPLDLMWVVFICLLLLVSEDDMSSPFQSTFSTCSHHLFSHVTRLCLIKSPFFLSSTNQALKEDTCPFSSHFAVIFHVIMQNSLKFWLSDHLNPSWRPFPVPGHIWMTYCSIIKVLFFYINSTLLLLFLDYSGTQSLIKESLLLTDLSYLCLGPISNSVFSTLLLLLALYFCLCHSLCLKLPLLLCFLL